MKFASLISQLTEPMAVFMVLALLGGWHADLRNLPYGGFIVYLMILSVVIWVVRLRLMKSLHTNWDVSDRPVRVRLLLLLFGFSIVFFLSLLFWDNTELTNLSGLFFVWLLGFFLITLLKKISGHMAVLTLTIGYSIIWYGSRLSPLFLLLPLVGWSRIVLKRHTWIEVIGGTLYSGLFLFVIRNLYA